MSVKGSGRNRRARGAGPVFASAEAWFGETGLQNVELAVFDVKRSEPFERPCCCLCRLLVVFKVSA